MQGAAAFSPPFAWRKVWSGKLLKRDCVSAMPLGAFQEARSSESLDKQRERAGLKIPLQSFQNQKARERIELCLL